MSQRRVVAMFALLFLALAVIWLVYTATTTAPMGLFAAILVIGALVLGWRFALGVGLLRIVSACAAIACLAGAVIVLAIGRLWIDIAIVVILLLGSQVLTSKAFRTTADLPHVPRPQNPVVFWNPKSGDGKALAADLAQEASDRGINPVELHEYDDLTKLVLDAIESGADALAAAGGDGTQATVAGIAAEHGLPFACIPAGTRNHFALDLGVDRDDVIGALDAFVNGKERIIDLGYLNGKPFVNNVSVGIYAEAVQRNGYRQAKLRTILSVTADNVNNTSENDDLSFVDGDGVRHHDAAVLLVSNNVYRLGAKPASGTRPHLDKGVLGISLLSAPGTKGHRGLVQRWKAKKFRIDSDSEVALGIDGEKASLPSPLHFTIRPHALRVRIASQHPGASPSAASPENFLQGLRMLAQAAFTTIKVDASS